MIVFTDAASTLLALNALPPVLSDAAASTLLAYPAVPPMLTDATATTLLAVTVECHCCLHRSEPSSLPGITIDEKDIVSSTGVRPSAC